MNSSAAPVSSPEFSSTGTGAPAPRLACLPAPPAAEENAGRGRPTLFSPELAAEVYKLIRAYGSTDSRAGLLAGVSTSTMSRWKQEDPAFCDYLEKARAEFELKRVLTLLEAMKPDGTPDWRAQAWLLKNAQRTGDEPRPGRPRKEAEPRTPVAEPTPTAAAAEKNTQKIPENQTAVSVAQLGTPEPPGVVLGGGPRSAMMDGMANGASPRDSAAGTNSEKIPENSRRTP